MSLTREQILNLVEFKAISRILKQRFPFIKKVVVPDSTDGFISLQFIDVYVNPYEMAEYFDKELESYVISAMKNGSGFSSVFLPVFFKDSKSEDFINFDEELKSLFRDIHSSPALPPDVKLPGTQRFDISEFIVDPNTKIRNDQEV